MDVIFVAGSWPPRREPRAVQNARLLSSLQWQGHLFLRRTPDEASDNSCVRPHIPGIQEHDIWSRGFYPVHRLLRRLGFHSNELPDEKLPWALRASLSSLRVRGGDLMVTVSHPLSTHITGLITKRFRKRLPWIVYFSDPWTDWGDVQFKEGTDRTRRINRWLESKVIKYADGLAFPSEELAAHFQQQHPIMAEKAVAVVPQSFDQALYPARTRVHNPGELLVRWLGDFYGPRTPMPLLEALTVVKDRWPRLLNVLKIELYGGRFQCYDKDDCLTKMKSLPVITHCGHVSYEQSLGLMVESDVLMNLDVKTETKYFRPSKLIDYLGAGRPLVSFSSEGAGSNFVTQANGFVANPGNPEQMAQVLRALCEAHASGALESRRPPSSVMESFTPQAVASKFAEFAEAVVERVRGNSPEVVVAPGA